VLATCCSSGCTSSPRCGGTFSWPQGCLPWRFRGSAGYAGFSSLKGTRHFYRLLGWLLAQLALFALTLSYLAVFGKPTTLFGTCLVQTFTLVNLVVILANVIPAGTAARYNDGRLCAMEAVPPRWRKGPHPLLAFAAPSIVFSSTRALSLCKVRTRQLCYRRRDSQYNSTPMNLWLALS